MKLNCASASGRFVLAFFLVARIAVAQDSQPAAAPLTFTVTYDPAIAESFSGRVYLMLTGRSMEPRMGPAWFGTEPFFAIDVLDWKPDVPLQLGETALAFPHKMTDLPERRYTIQAVMRRNLDSPTLGQGEGTAYSAAMTRTLSGGDAGNLDLRVDQIVGAENFAETDRIKLVELRSDLLSDFHHRDIIMRAAVILPPDYSADPDRRYPALYWIGGFGSDHGAARYMSAQWDRTGLADDIVRIVVDPLCYGGHHVFADSENNGPRGKALVQEFIPHLEKTFRLVAAPTARFLSGHSSGGWSGLWLQITYPDFFGGVWAIAPDPVDFRDFQRINLYQPGINMYRDEGGEQRPIARHGERIMALYEPFAKMEVVHGEGGQLRSFEWVFSKRGADGKPEALYDRETGEVNAQVAESWKRYDIRLILENNWQTLGPRLSNGKEINIVIGDQDTFYLEGATKLLKQSLDALGSAAVIEVVAGADHGSVASAALRERIDRELLEIFRAHHPEHATAPAMP